MRSGLLQLDCAQCTADDKANIGCTNNIDQCFYIFDGDEYYTCPSKFITKGTVDFIRRYDTIKCGMSQPYHYDDSLHVWNEALLTYEHFLSICQSEKTKVNNINLDSFN